MSEISATDNPFLPPAAPTGPTTSYQEMATAMVIDENGVYPRFDGEEETSSKAYPVARGIGPGNPNDRIILSCFGPGGEAKVVMAVIDKQPAPPITNVEHAAEADHAASAAALDEGVIVDKAKVASTADTLSATARVPASQISGNVSVADVAIQIRSQGESEVLYISHNNDGNFYIQGSDGGGWKRINNA